MDLLKLQEIISQGEYDFFGIRVDSKNKYNVGDTCENSHTWYQDNPEDDSEYNEDLHMWDGGELNGTCCLKVTPETLESVLQRAEKMYFGDKITLIAGDYAEGGNDKGELIIEDAKVIAVIK